MGFVKHGNKYPTFSHYDYKLQSGVLTIEPNTKGYYKQGTYFITIYPDFSLVDLFIDNYYTFTLSWRLSTTIPHVNSHTLTQLKTQPYSFSYLRHYI